MSSSSFRLHSSVLVLTLMIISVPANGQSVNDRLGSIGASDPEYAPIPMRVGAFEVYPRIDVELEFNDNVFASQFDAVDDIILSFVPSITALDRRPDREIFVRAEAGVDTFLDGTFGEQFRGQLEGRARLGLGTRTRPYFGARISRNNSRGQAEEDFRFVAQPIQITQVRGNAGIEQDFGPLTGVVEATALALAFDGDFIVDGQPFDIGFRDNEVYEGRAQLAYSRSESQRVFVELVVNQQNFDGDGFIPGLPDAFLRDRSSSGYRVQVGYQRRLTELLTLSARVGYLRQNFDAPEFGAIEGLSFEGDLRWRPTRLTTVTARALRAIDQQINPLFSGGLRTEIATSVEHELFRNVSIGARGRYAWIENVDLGGTVNEWNLSASARYRVDRHWSLALQGERFERNDIFPFDQNRVFLSARYDF